MKKVKDCERILFKRSESTEATEMKRKLCRLGQTLAFEVDIEEQPESELGDLGIRHDVLWYSKPPDWYRELLRIMLARPDLERGYRDLLESKQLERMLYTAFEIEAKDQTTKGMKGDISNLSKLPLGFIVVRRGSEDNASKGEPIRNRFERALIEFRKLHGPNNVFVVSFEDIDRLLERISQLDR